MFQGIFKSAINDANKNYIFGTGSIPINIKTAQLATFVDDTTKQQGYQVAEVNKLISTMLTSWDKDGNKPKSMSDNYLELILSCDNGFVIKKRLQFPHIIAWQNDSTPYNIANVYKEFNIDNWLKADDFENPDITLVVEPTDEILTTSTATPPEVTTTNSGRFYLYYRNLPVGVNRIHIDFNIKTKTEPIDFDLEVIDGFSWKDAQTILASNEQAKINVLLSSVKDVYKFNGAEGNFDEITMYKWGALYQSTINLNPNNKFTHDLCFYLYEESEINTKITELKRKVGELEGYGYPKPIFVRGLIDTTTGENGVSRYAIRNDEYYDIATIQNIALVEGSTGNKIFLCYDQDKSYLGYVWSFKSLKENTKYLRLSINATNSSLGPLDFDHPELYVTITMVSVKGRIPTIEEHVEHIDRDIDELKGAISFQTFVPSYSIIEGEYVNANGSAIIQSSSYNRTSFIEVKKGDTLRGAWGIAGTAGLAYANSESATTFTPLLLDSLIEKKEREYTFEADGFAIISYYKNNGLDNVTIERKGKLDKVIADVEELSPIVSKLSADYSMPRYDMALMRPICMGDSLTSGANYKESWGEMAGTGASIDENYPRYLGKILNTEVTNKGQGGYSASDWWKKFIYTENIDLTQFDSAILWFGTNKGCKAMPTDEEINSFVPNPDDTATTGNQALYLIKLINLLKEAHSDMHIVLMTIFAGSPSPSVNNPIVEQIAVKYGCQLIDMSDLSQSAHPELHCNVNNPHFGKAGNIYIASRIANSLREYFAREPLRCEFGYSSRKN